MNRITRAVLVAGGAIAIGAVVGGAGTAHADAPVIYGDKATTTRMRSQRNWRHSVCTVVRRARRRLRPLFVTR